MEAIVQNTAKVTELLNDRRNIDLYPARYSIIGSKYTTSNQDVTRNIYQKDQEAYYPYVDPAKEDERSMNLNKVNDKVQPRPTIYDKDKWPYYSPAKNYVVLPYAKPGKETPVVMADLERVFPSAQNLNNLKVQLTALNLRENPNADEVYNKGIYKGDAKPYYDPTSEDTDDSIKSLTESIKQMEQNINHLATHDLPTVQIDTYTVHPKVQNEDNFEAEQRYIHAKESTIIPIITKGGFDVEAPIGTKVNTPIPKDPIIASPRVPAEEISHVFVEAEEKTQNNSDNSQSQQQASRKNLKQKTVSNSKNNKIKSQNDIQVFTFNDIKVEKGKSTKVITTKKK